MKQVSMEQFDMMIERKEEKRRKKWQNIIKETIKEYGAKSVSERELLAAIIGNDDAAKILLEKADYDLNEVAKMSVSEIVSCPELKGKGIGTGKASALLAALELGKRMKRKKINDLPSCATPHEVADYLMEEMSSYDEEHFKILLLNAKVRIFKEEEVSVGTVNSSMVHPREVFCKAIRQHAVSIILAHNHPSGDPYPSMEDQVITTRLKEAGELLGITVLDHIIIGKDDYVSFRELGLLS